MHNNFHGYLANPWPCRSVNNTDSFSFKCSPINHKCLSEKSRGALHLDEVVFLIPGSYSKSELTCQVSYWHSVLPRSPASVQIQMHVPLVFWTPSVWPSLRSALHELRLEMALPYMCEGQWSADLGKAGSSLQWESCFHMCSALYLKDILICSALWPSRQHSWCSKANGSASSG